MRKDCDYNKQNITMVICDSDTIHLIIIEVEGGKYFFNTVKEGDNVTLATDDENERTLWVQAVYRATGQTHKPVPPVIQTNRISNTQISRMQGGMEINYVSKETTYLSLRYQSLTVL